MIFALFLIPIALLIYVIKRYDALWATYTQGNETFKKTITEMGAIVENNQVYIKHLQLTNKIHTTYIKELEASRRMSKEKVDELLELVPMNGEFLASEPLRIQEVTDTELAGVVMFRKVDDALRAVEKLDPNSELAKELREILK